MDLKRFYAKTIVVIALVFVVVGIALVGRPVHAQSDAAIPATGMPIDSEAYASVPASAELTHPLKTGARVPPGLVLAGTNGKPFDLDKAIKAKPTVLIFYRGGWCPFCNAQMASLEQTQPKLTVLGYQLLAISPDTIGNESKSIDKHHLTYTLLSDSDLTAARAFGLAWRVNDETLTRMKGFGIDLEKATGRKLHMLPVPAAYVIDQTGAIRYAYANPDYKVRVNPDDLLAAAKAALSN